jgi:serine/threonine protein phosphatase PrpC
VIIPKFGGDPSAVFFGVFDGHGGKEVAEFAKKHLPDELLTSSYYATGNIEKALVSAFLKIDVLLDSEQGLKEITTMAKENNEKASQSPTKMGLGNPEDDGPNMKGCTANVLLIKNKIIYVANAGDSRAILGSKGKAVELSFDHKPDILTEKTRITKAGGSVEEGRINGNLNLSRALGDLTYKNNKSLKPEEQMVTALPDVYKYPLTNEFEFVLMGCDGVYERKSNQEIVDFMYSKIKSSASHPLKNAIESFLDTNISDDYNKSEGAGCDNMTCILIKFKHWKP